jgi:hypothetical protein
MSGINSKDLNQGEKVQNCGVINPRERLVSFTKARALRLETQWTMFSGFLKPLMVEEARVLGKDVDKLMDPICAGVEGKLPRLAEKAWELTDKGIKFFTKAARDLS